MPTISYGLDGEGRPTSVSAGSGQNPVTAASYSALGLTSLTLGSGVNQTYSYDSRAWFSRKRHWRLPPRKRAAGSFTVTYIRVRSSPSLP